MSAPSGSHGYTLLEDAFDMPMSAPTLPQPVQPQNAMMYGAPQASAPHQNQQRQHPPTATQHQQQQSQSQPVSLTKQQQEQVAVLHETITNTMLNELGRYFQIKDRDTRDQMDQLYSMFSTKQSESTDSVTESMNKYCSSLEILLFVVIATLVVSIIVQIVMCRKLSQLAAAK